MNGIEAENDDEICDAEDTGHTSVMLVEPSQPEEEKGE